MPSSTVTTDQLDADLARLDALFERVTEARRRTDAIVDRLCPAVPMPSFSTRYPELTGPRSAWDRFNDNMLRRKALYRAIKPRMDAKVQARREAESRVARKVAA